jgi:hypothetical protein
MNVRRCKVSGRREVPGVGANLDGEGSGVTKVENHGLRSVHSPARLDLSVLYGRYRFPTDSRIVCSLYSGVGRLSWGVLRYSPVGCPSVLLRLLADDLYLPTPRVLSLLAYVPRPGSVKHVTSWRR